MYFPGLFFRKVIHSYTAAGTAVSRNIGSIFDLVSNMCVCGKCVVPVFLPPHLHQPALCSVSKAHCFVVCFLVFFFCLLRKTTAIQHQEPAAFFLLRLHSFRCLAWGLCHWSFCSSETPPCFMPCIKNA